MNSIYKKAFFRRNNVIFWPVNWFWIIFWLQMTPLSWKVYAENNFTKYVSWRSVGQFLSSHQKFWCYFLYLFFFSFFKDFAIENFLRVANLSFDARFARHSQFSLHHDKQCQINNIKVKCPQIGQNLCDSFWTCSLQIVPDIWRWLLIS